MAGIVRRSKIAENMKGKVLSTEEAVRIEAYLLSEKAGHPSGMEAYFWEQAQGIVKARNTAVAGAVKKAAATKAKAKPKSAPKKNGGDRQARGGGETQGESQSKSRSRQEAEGESVAASSRTNDCLRLPPPHGNVFPLAHSFHGPPVLQ